VAAGEVFSYLFMFLKILVSHSSYRAICMDMSTGIYDFKLAV